MARLYRPHIPLKVRIEVALRQWFERNMSIIGYPVQISGESDSAFLGRVLKDLFGDRPYALDHDPALVNRRKREDLTYDKKTDGVKTITIYTPDANDPRFLKYREAGPGSDHDIKTRVRGERGQLSDLGLARKEKRRTRKKVKRKWPSRPFPKRIKQCVTR